MKAEIEKSIFGKGDEARLLKETNFWTRGIKTADRWNNYEAFVEKFKPKPKPKLTTDDCYTPPLIMQCVKDYVTERLQQEANKGTCSIANVDSYQIIRPFKPEGDYESEDYNGKIVIDNPPFSILGKILDFYNERNIPYFLFAPHMTLFQHVGRATLIVCGSLITYENGAKVRTSFATNLWGAGGIEVRGTLLNRLEEAGGYAKTKANLPSYEYPEAVITVSRLHKIALAGDDFCISGEALKRVGTLDCQRAFDKKVFGAGAFIGEQTQKALSQALSQAQDKRNATKIVWGLSEKERAIISGLR